mgnify:CR=1 FL=1
MNQKLVGETQELILNTIKGINKELTMLMFLGEECSRVFYCPENDVMFEVFCYNPQGKLANLYLGEL